MKLEYRKDENGEEGLYSVDGNHQVMMEWEREYMNKCIEVLEPYGDVLEIGFGMAYSADKIQSYNIKSHTIIECNPLVLKRLEEYKKTHPNVIIVEGRWQDVLETCEKFDCVFFDDYPVQDKNDSTRFLKFLMDVLNNHSKKNTRVSVYSTTNCSYLKNCPNISLTVNEFKVDIPEYCKYAKGDTMYTVLIKQKDILQEKLIELVDEPYNPLKNFYLALEYHKFNQTAIALSYYLRCAEFTDNKIISSEALLRASLCVNAQRGRDEKELYLIKHAITASPNSIEPYYVASLFYSWRSGNIPEKRFWLDCYQYACLGVNIIENGCKSEPFMTNFGYTEYNIYFQKAFAGSNIGKIDEAREIYTKILSTYELDSNTKNIILEKKNKLPEPNHPIIPYSRNNLDNLKLIFNNSDKIDVNYSQIYQDMYILSMHNGKMNGTYLEIGAGDYKYGNNTYLLEREFNWMGKSIDFNKKLVDKFNSNRKNSCLQKDATTIDYLELLSTNYTSTNIDYLQLDCDPPNITFDILNKIPFDQYKFGVITYEHDFYNDITGTYREKSREFLKEKGYKLIAGNISPYGDKCPFEDWWIHPEVIDENIWKLFERDNDEPINGEKYMLTKSEILNNNMISINRHVETKTIKEDLILSNTILDNFQIKNKEILNLNNLHAQWYENLSGINEYRLYSYLSTLFNNIVILDIGTGFGISAVALSHNENNHVISYNLIDQIGDNSKIYTKKNITFKIKNVLEDLTEDFIKNIKIIMIDIDHFGEEERKIIDTLEELNYSGIVILDDIHHPWKKEGKCMKELWESINYTKYDITKYGHNTGTGIFFMKFYMNIIEEKVETTIETKQVAFSHNDKIYSPKIIDCFIFYNELDLLNYRLNLLDDYVDYFVLVEATHTHTGKEKKLFYDENKELFQKFKDKIVHVIVDDFLYKFPNINIEKNEQWSNEHFQRNCIKRGIDKLSLNNKDIITICDLDEIPNPKILNELKDNKRQITKSSLKMDMYYYNLNNKSNINNWISPKLFSYNEFVKLFINKTMITDCIKRGQRDEEVKLDIIENGGWHLSFFGDKDFIINKIKSYTHQELNNDEIISNIEEKIKSNKELFSRENHEIQYIDIQDNENLPPKYEIYLQKYFTLEIKENTNLINDFYDFVPCHDQIGNDLYRVDVSNIKNTLKTLAFSPEIQAVNTQGYVKNKVDKIKQLNDWWYPNDGIYIKKPINDYLKQISQKSIPVFGTLVCSTTKWLIKQLKSIDYPIENFIIINNNSKVLAKELDIIVKKEYKFIKNLKVYHMPYNLGCAEGWNMIMKSFMFSPYWIISNDDVSFGPGVLKNMNLAAQNPEVGLVHKNPILLPNLEKFGTFELFLIKDWVVQKYGLFDTNFYPAYFEDYDYIMRLMNDPIKIINTIDGIIYHGDTSDYNISGANTIKNNDKVKTRLLIAKYKNFEYFIKKWNCYPEAVNDINKIYKFPFGNSNNRLNYTYFDMDFSREKHLLDTLDSTNLSVNNTVVNIKENLFVKQNLIVIDNFYTNPDKIREYALSLNYQPPENHGAVGYRCESGRNIEDGTKELFEKLLHANIPDGNKEGEWNYSTNGCFQWCNAKVPIVYHADSQQYAGIIYLTPDAPPECGTSFLRHKKYKLRNSEIFSKSDWYQSDLNYKEPHLDKTQWEVVDSIGNVYNRLVIFDAQYIHAVSQYFGEDINNSRLFQLFFFNITK